MQEFQLRVVPTENNYFALEIYQCSYKRAGEKKRPPAQKMGRIQWGNLVLVRQTIYGWLKENNYDPQTMSYKRQAPYILDEVTGIKCYLLFWAISPLKKEEKIRSIASGIEGMARELACYWFSETSFNPKAFPALRILLG